MDSINYGNLDDNFNLSERETSDEKGEGIMSYLGDSIVDPNIVLSMGRMVALDLTSCEAILPNVMNSEEDTRKKKRKKELDYFVCMPL